MAPSGQGRSLTYPWAPPHLTLCSVPIRAPVYVWGEWWRTPLLDPHITALCAQTTSLSHCPSPIPWARSPFLNYAPEISFSLTLMTPSQPYCPTGFAPLFFQTRFYGHHVNGAGYLVGWAPPAAHFCFCDHHHFTIPYSLLWDSACSSMKLEHLGGWDRTSVAFLSPTSLQLLAQSWHLIQSVGKHGVICVYRDQSKIPIQHWGSPTASLFLLFPGTNPLWWICTCPHRSSCSLLLLFSSESCPSCGACLKPHPFLVFSLFGLLSGPYQQLPSTISYMEHLDLPTGRGIKIFSCGTVSRKQVIPQWNRMSGFKS